MLLSAAGEVLVGKAVKRSCVLVEYFFGLPGCWLPVVPDYLVLWTLGCVTNQMDHVHHFPDPHCPVREPSATGQAKMCPED